MRIWNGITANIIVEYKNKKYFVKRTYKKGEERVADLHSHEEDLEGISVFECKKIQDE